MKNKKKIFLFLFIALFVITVLIIRGRKNNSPEIIFKEINPFYGSVRVVISTTGTVQPQNRLEIKPPISGRIEEILVREGQKVEAGETLALMSSTERAALLDAAHMQDDTELSYWKEVYKATPLISPIDGEVIVRAVEPGQTVLSSDAVIVLSDRLIVKVQVDETDIGAVEVGQEAVVSLDAYPEIKVEGKVNHISYESKIVNNVTIYEVDVLPKEVPDVFRSGMSANVDIIKRGKEDVLLLPLEAVKQDKEGSFVLLSQGKGKKPVKRRVELGISDETNVEVISGLEASDEIIIETQNYTPSKNNKAGGNPLMPFGRRR